jgi:hypothetical protein
MVVALITATALTGVAQQTSKHVPSMSSDGITISKSSDSGRGEWRRYEPEGFGLSVELPGQPFERAYPVPPALQSAIVAARVFDYAEVGLVVNIAHVVYSKRRDLRSTAEEIRSSLAHAASIQNPTIALVPEGDKFLLHGGFTSYGTEVEIQGVVLGSAKEVWFIDVQTVREKPNGAAITSRILDSVTTSH